jgi:uncharacterized protein YndB with AHSA1/START domain
MMATTFEPATGAERKDEERATTRCARLAAEARDGHAPREVTVTRAFDAPRELVFQAWTEQRRIQQWWAPKDCAVLFCRLDVRPGGAFHYCIRDWTGRSLWGIGTYLEIVAPERLVYTDLFADPMGHPRAPAHHGMRAGHPSESLVSITFEEQAPDSKQGGRNIQTLLTVRQTQFESTIQPCAARSGWETLLDQLADQLAVWKTSALEVVRTE